MPRPRLLIGLIAILLVAAAACSDSDSEGVTSTGPSSTTESSIGTATSAAQTPGNGTAAGPASTTAAGGTDTVPAGDEFAIPSYSIEAREVSATGDTVVVLLAPGTYSDLDLENVVADVVQRFAPIATVHVVDDREAVALVLGELDLADTAAIEALDAHYFARLEEGFRLVFEGPFDALPEVILGS